MPSKKPVVVYKLRAFLEHPRTVLERGKRRKRTGHVTCPVCREAGIELRDYQKHCRDLHNIDPLLQCSFCQGLASWPRQQKYRHGDHVLTCAKRFYDLHGQDAAAPVEEPAAMIRYNTDPCPQDCFMFETEYHRPRANRIPAWTVEQEENCGVHLMYEPLFVRRDLDEWLPLKTRAWILNKARRNRKWYALLNPLRFHPRSGLGEVHEWIFRYLVHEKEVRFYHLMVRAACMKSFARAMRDVDIGALPYGCVCNGGDSRVGIDNHHRHLLLVVKDEEAYIEALKNLEFGMPVEGSEQPYRYYNRKIVDIHHFVQALVYVSRWRNTCACPTLLEEDAPDRTQRVYETYNAAPSERGHYYIFNPVVAHASWWILMLVPENGMDHFGQFKVGGKRVSRIETLERRNRKWRVCASKEFKMENCVVCFDPPNLRIDGPMQDLEEQKAWIEGGEPFVYWFDDQVLRVGTFPSVPEHPEIFRDYCVQYHHNTLLNLVFAECWFDLQRKLVRHANDIEELKERVERMQRGQRDRQVEDVVADYRAKRLEFETRLNEERAVSERRLERIGELERENARLSNEIDTVWRLKVKTLQQRVRRLTEKNRE